MVRRHSWLYLSYTQTLLFPAPPTGAGEEEERARGNTKRTTNCKPQPALAARVGWQAEEEDFFGAAVAAVVVRRRRSRSARPTTGPYTHCCLCLSLAALRCTARRAPGFISPATAPAAPPSSSASTGCGEEGLSLPPSLSVPQPADRNEGELIALARRGDDDDGDVDVGEEFVRREYEKATG